MVCGGGLLYPYLTDEKVYWSNLSKGRASKYYGWNFSLNGLIPQSIPLNWTISPKQVKKSVNL